MQRPEMILFDFGDTLIYEPDWNSERGDRELWKYLTKNPHNYTVEDLRREIYTVFDRYHSIKKAWGCDLPYSIGHRLAFEHLGLEFSLTPLEVELVFWTAGTPGAPTPGVEDMLAELDRLGIRTAVVSNNGWSAQAIRARLDALVPGHRLEFVLSSCDYMVRKPDPRLFEIALEKAGLSAEKVWYCGDSIELDVNGAHNAGLFPVLYEGDIPKAYREHDNTGLTAAFPYLHIHHWQELTETLAQL